ncbi:DUF397 domain-containing protein [Actinoplanes sp. LDG1-06]|uniref:DUF397 domain-containing protein n=1 Tax=Paractinoplanes ovalisporus TaxID=2810368 RepID=A0ABS2AVB6_9ACTN|nr:DUF397 domain-containing protein [Actinoplanes ovalisporus]MBM2623795.1 DUF397 domain-containing protein [Actinoplanes ovalisporus]
MLAKHFGDAGGEWLRSRSCVGEGNCVELLASVDGSKIHMRNSTMPGTTLSFDAIEWRNFIDAIKAGELPLTR